MVCGSALVWYGGFRSLWHIWMVPTSDLYGSSGWSLWAGEGFNSRSFLCCHLVVAVVSLLAVLFLAGLLPFGLSGSFSVSNVIEQEQRKIPG